jgi:hypothetical protein
MNAFDEERRRAARHRQEVAAQSARAAEQKAQAAKKMIADERKATEFIKQHPLCVCTDSTASHLLKEFVDLMCKLGVMPKPCVDYRRRPLKMESGFAYRGSFVGFWAWRIGSYIAVNTDGHLVQIMGLDPKPRSYVKPGTFHWRDREWRKFRFSGVPVTDTVLVLHNPRYYSPVTPDPSFNRDLRYCERFEVAPLLPPVVTLSTDVEIHSTKLPGPSGDGMTREVFISLQTSLKNAAEKALIEKGT